jgi:hypothetical protein
MHLRQMGTITFISLAMLVLSACSSGSENVASLGPTLTPVEERQAQTEEERVIEFAECLRNEGMEITDPSVDAEGNIQMPELVEGATATKEEWGAAYEVCGEIIENITFEKKKVDRSAQLDEYLEIAACLREEGINVNEPTAETLEIWMEDLKDTIDWEDPDVEKAVDACFGGELGEGSKKENQGK